MFKIHFPKKIAILNHNKKITYQELDLYSKELSKILEKKKRLVFLDSKNSLSFFIIYYFLMNSKHTVLLIDSSLNFLAVKKLIKNYKPSYYITSRSENFKNFHELKLKNISPFKIIFFKKFLNYKIKRNIKILLSTSGSIGDPKSAMLTLENLKNNTEAINKYLNLKHYDRTITTMNPSYSYGMSIINTHFYANASIFVTNATLFEKDFYNFLKKFKITNINGVPFFYEIIARLGFEKILNKNLKFFTQAGGALSSKIYEKILDLILKNNKIFYIMYGQTEASPRISYKKIDKSCKNTDYSIGKPVVGGKLYLDKKSIKKINKTNVGELIYEGKNIFCGYAETYKDLNKTKSFRKLRTGDLSFKKNNEFYIYGRKKREIKIFGHRINLDYIQNEIFHEVENICIFKNNCIHIYAEKKINLTKVFKFNDFLKKKIILHKIKNLPRLKNKKLDYKYFDEK